MTATNGFWNNDEFAGADSEEVDPGKFAVCVYIQGSD